MEPIISIRGLGKSYQIRTGEKKRYRTLRDDVADAFTGLLQGKVWRSQTEEFWAVKDIDLDIYPGEVVGLIGRNGAGKSTLLKILSRVTQPTVGEAVLHGRVASLLEVGTGFHPELTGRENIFMSGAVLGMHRAEIKSKFDEIVAFAEVEKFLDTPVKRYSSGMYVRLAFAVAAHLEPEILLVDEVLAVGDAAFQKKCLGKMKEASKKEGKTVLFVSHQMATIQSLCNQGILMSNGEILEIGETRSIVHNYLEGIKNYSRISLLDRKDRQGDGRIRFTSLLFQNTNRVEVNQFQTGEEANLILVFQRETQESLKNVKVSLGINNPVGERITVLSNEMSGDHCEFTEANENAIEISIDKLPLMPGRYTFTIYCAINDVISDWIQDAGSFDVEDGDFFGTGKLLRNSQGYLLINHRLRAIKLGSSL
jgi:lipopolysaccharide transport system ATP-binding protein